MSGLANPRKNFRYILEFDGANAFQIQEVQAPSIEYPIVKHGAPVNDPDSKTPGKVQFGEMVVKKLMPAINADTWVEDWMATAVAGIASSFIKTGFLKHMAPDGVTVVQKWFLGDVWPSKLEQSNLVSMGPGENIIQTVTFAVKYYVPVDSPLFATLLIGGAAAGIGAAAGRNS